MAENKQDQGFDVSEALGRTEHFVNQNKKSLGIIIGALIVAIGGYLFYQNVYVSGKEKEAQVLLFHAEQYMDKDSLKLAINGDGNNPGFEEIASEYGMAPSGNLSKYYLGMAYLHSHDYEKAIEALKSYNAKDHITGAIVLGAIGDALMELKETDEAISYYKKAAQENANNYTSPLMMMKWAGALESAGKYMDASGVYEQLKKDYPGTNEAAQADKYIARAKAFASNS
ncbi:MAG: tetratricopeptide repeat protein [Bacteroidia bacterium]|nr:tetratricopeptide repeat protein [Bacteroidia bacterium]